MAHPAPLAKAAILMLLAARPTLTTVDRRWFAPTEEEDISDNMIWLGDTNIPSDDWSELGAQRRRMTFQIEMTAAVRRYGDDPQETEQAVWALFDEIVAAIRTDPTLGGAVQQFNAVPGKQQLFAAGPQQWEAMITAQVVCVSRAY